MKRYLLLAPVFVAACAQSVPNSAPQGVGFGSYLDYDSQRAAREQTLAGAAPPGGLPISNETLPPGAPRTVAEGPPVDLNNPAISDEQSFEAVTARESIESDAERLARARAERQQAPVEPLPERPRGAAPNIVEYALATTNAVGQALYQRDRTSSSRHQRACGRYPTADRAQEAFLADGGPERDPQGLDPDGDGFACGWNPVPFRAVRSSGAPRTEAEAIATDALSVVGAGQ